MADKDELNDEYQFADLDAMTPESSEETQDISEKRKPLELEEAEISRQNMKRNGAIAVVGLIVIILLYKLLGGYLSGTKAPTKMAAMTPPITAAPVVHEPVPVPVSALTPPPQPAQTANPPQDTQITQKISALQLNQESVKSEVATVGNQLNAMSTNMNELIAKVGELNKDIASLSAKIDEQSHEIDRLTILKVHPPVHRATRRSTSNNASSGYYIQAVIPGRAWLIASNGSTLTVREGTVVPGLGVVKLIDPTQGRVLTSSGQVIRFSQEDS